MSIGANAVRHVNESNQVFADMKETKMNIMTLLAGGAGAIAILAAGTMLLPRHVHVERQALVNAEPQTIIALAASNEGYQAFNPYKKVDPELKITQFGPSSGIGSGFHFDGKDGKGSQTVAEVTDKFVRYNIDLGAKGQPTQTIHAENTDQGVVVTWSMDADLGINPIARIIGLFMDGMLGKTFEDGLDHLNSATS